MIDGRLVSFVDIELLENVLSIVEFLQHDLRMSLHLDRISIDDERMHDTNGKHVRLRKIG